MEEELLYPTPGDVLAIHEDVVMEDPGTVPGVRSPGQIASALWYVSGGYAGQSPGTIHEIAAHIMRLLVVGHPFLDGNKRTALNTVSVFYEINGFEFDYADESVRSLLRRLATDAESVDTADVVEYCREHARPAEE